MQVHGPYEINSRGQVSVPKELRDKLNLDVGSAVYLALNPDRTGSLLLVPAELVAAWLTAGQTAMASEIEDGH